MSAEKSLKKYLIVSPCRDEAEFIEHTLHSVINQTVTPDLWLIVDDGSTDETPEILQRYAEQYPFIQIYTRKNRGFRNVGPGVVEAFYAGLEQVDWESFEFLCKLDLDVELPHKYFETLLDRMEQDPRLGTCSGKPYNLRDGKLISERRSDDMSVGMSKFYRTECFKQIGGIVHEVMWDAIDCHKARHLGWKARSWDEQNLQFIHLRTMGSSQKGVLTGRMRHGYGQYFMGTGFIYILASAMFRMLEYPQVIGSMAVVWGYLRSWLMGQRRYPEPELRAFINDFQWSTLIRGREQAIDQFEEMARHRWLSENAPADVNPA